MCARRTGSRVALGIAVCFVATSSLAQNRFPHGGSLPIYGIWAYSEPPAEAAAAAGFDWFETGYPGQGWNWRANSNLKASDCVPLAYINVGQLEPSLDTHDPQNPNSANYTGTRDIGRDANGNLFVDVTDASWQSWILRRVDQAIAEGSGGIKWDIADPAANDDPSGCSNSPVPLHAIPTMRYPLAKSRSQVNGALASIYSQVRAKYPGIVMVHNQGFKFACEYPQYVDGLTTEGLFTARSYPSAYLQPWLDPYYWGPQYNECAAYLQPRGIPCIDITEDVDPYSNDALEIYKATTAKNFVPYIVNDFADPTLTFQQKGRGLHIAPNWPPWPVARYAALPLESGFGASWSNDVYGLADDNLAASATVSYWDRNTTYLEFSYFGFDRRIDPAQVVTSAVLEVEAWSTLSNLYSDYVLVEVLSNGLVKFSTTQAVALKTSLGNVMKFNIPGLTRADLLDSSFKVRLRYYADSRLVYLKATAYVDFVRVTVSLHEGASDLVARLGRAPNLLVGLRPAPDPNASYAAQVQAQGIRRVDILEYYLNNVASGDWINWGCATPPCAGVFVTQFAGQADILGAIPMFTVYQMRKLGDGNLSGLSNVDFMRNYWASIRILFDRLAVYNKPAVVLFEPDFWGYAQQQNPPVVLVGSVCPECASLSEDVPGMAQCLFRFARLKAPRVAVGLMPSKWAGTTEEVANFMVKVHAGDGDFLAIETSDRDAGCSERWLLNPDPTIPAADLDMECRRGVKVWDDARYDEHFAMARYLQARVRRPLIWWQTSLGRDVPDPPTLGKPGWIPADYRDNHVARFFSNPYALTQSGGAAMIFGAGNELTQTLIGQPGASTGDRGQFKRASDGYYFSPVNLP